MSLAKYRLTRIAADGAVAAVGTNVKALLLCGGAAAAGTLALYNAASATGTQVLDVMALTGDSVYLDLTALGGVQFTSKCFADIGGSGAVAYIWHES